MDVEARLLLYTVVLGAAAGFLQLAHRRAWAFRVYMAVLAALLAVSIAALLVPSLTRVVAWPAFWAFVAVAIVPSALLETARGAARSRRYGASWAASTIAAALLGMPAPIRREAALYGALAAAERGDETTCRRRLERMQRGVGIPADLGGAALVRVLPAAALRRWEDVLAALADAPFRPAPLLAVEVRAAADTGDLRRALRACRELNSFGQASARSSARRCLLAAAGRASFLEEATQRGMPLVAGPPGTSELAVARAREALGDASAAAAGYEAARRASRGGARIDAEAGARRCAEGALLLVKADELETAALLDLEAACRAERAPPEAAPLLRRAPFTLGATVVTAIISTVVLLVLGADSIAFLAAGALSGPLIAAEHEWWRLGAAILLHGGWFHLAMNLGAIVFVGIPLETRIGPSRTAIVYLGAGFIASAASAYGAGTDVGVGASGAAMGLIGALAVLLLRRPLLFGAAERRSWLGALSLTVVATLAVGLAESQAIDNTAHGVGLVGGALLAWLVLPGGLDTATHVAARRLAAIGLCALMLGCVWATAAHLREWTGESVVEARGARATLPTWLHVKRPAESLVEASRAPAPLEAQFGAAPAVARPEDLAVDSKEWRELRAHGPTSTRFEDDPSCRIDDYVGATGAGFRLRTFRNGPAFALVIVPLDDEGGADGDALAVRIGRSLAAVE